MALTSSNNKLQDQNFDSTKNYTAPLIVITTLFFMWGFMSHLNGSLSPYMQNLFKLDDLNVSLIQFFFFGAYFLMSFPASIIINKIGYKNGIIIGLLLCALGAFLFYPAAKAREYSLFLTALFTLASGITTLQVGANAYVSILGKPEHSSSRLNLSQAFNSLGGTMAPIIGSYFILNNIENLSPELQAQKVETPYIIISGVFILLALLIYFAYLPKIKFNSTKGSGVSIWSFRHTILGAVGIFTYVGAEVAVETYLIKFISGPNIGNMSAGAAAKYATLFYLGMMIGRFAGAYLMLKFSPRKMLGTLGVGAVGLVLIAIFTDGTVAMIAILLVGLCNSIMFPTIFTLGIKGLGNHTAQGAALLIQAIVGGALIPPMQGALSVATGSLQLSFFVPVVCYLYITYYGFVGSQPKITETA